MKRKITALLLALFMLLCFANVIYAAEPAGKETEDISQLSAEEISGEGEIIESEMNPDTVSAANAASYDNDEEEEEKNEENTGIFDTILDHVSEILSILTFIISLLLTLFYKKGLMPSVNGALCSIGDSVKSFGIQAEESLSSAKATVNGISDRIDDIRGVVKEFEAAIGTIEKRMCELEEIKTDGEHTKLLVRTDVEELYEIFTDRSGKEINLDIIEKKLTEIKAKLS